MLYQQSSYRRRRRHDPREVPETVSPTNLSTSSTDRRVAGESRHARRGRHQRTDRHDHRRRERGHLPRGHLPREPLDRYRGEGVRLPANAFSNTGKTEKTKETELKAIEEKGTLNVVNRSVSVAELAQALELRWA